jgi:hypothetical protein
MWRAILLELKMNKIKHVSFFFRIFFQTVFIITPIALIITWIKIPEPLLLLNGIKISMIQTDEYPILHILTLNTRFLGFLLSLIPTSVELVILYFLIRLFRLYESGIVFTMANVLYIRNIAYALLIGQLIHPIYEGLMGLILTWGNPPGHRFASVSFSEANIGIILMAFFVILISWIMAEGSQLAEEQKLTI